MTPLRLQEKLGPPPPLPLPRLLLAPGTIAANDLEFGASIGNGEFGKVYQGRWRDPRGQQVSARDAGVIGTPV